MFPDLDATLTLLADRQRRWMRAAEVVRHPSKLRRSRRRWFCSAQAAEKRATAPCPSAAIDGRHRKLSRRADRLYVPDHRVITPSSDLLIADGHRPLGAAVLWLSETVLPAAMLVGSLGNRAAYPVPTRLAPIQADEDLATFWTALGIAPRPMFSLTATIAMQPYLEVEELASVEAVDIDGVSMQYPGLTGRVLDAAMAPVPGADVAVVEKNQHVTSDQRGRFEFGELPFGIYTLLVSVPNRADVQQSVNYQAAGQVHNVYLPAP